MQRQLLVRFVTIFNKFPHDIVYCNQSSSISCQEKGYHDIYGQKPTSVRFQCPMMAIYDCDDDNVTDYDNDDNGNEDDNDRR